MTNDELLREFFLNRDAVKRIKEERNNYLSQQEQFCLFTDEKDCDCVHDSRLDIKKFCAICKKRHAWYLELHKLYNRNRGIMRTLRNRIKSAMLTQREKEKE